MKLRMILAGVVALFAAELRAQLYVVNAFSNSSSGGSPVATISLAAGEGFVVTVNTSDLWSAGALPRWSDANGLTGNRFATGSDESGAAAGTLIGADFGSWTQNGFTAPFGALVGRVNTNYFLLGTSFSGVAANTGLLELFYWDSNFGDNSGSILADVRAVPEPSTYALLGAFALVALIARRKFRRKQA